MDESDILIVGAGIFGLSTAVHLAEDSAASNKPLKVTLLDTRPHAPQPRFGGASNDVNKIVRADYTDPFYTELGYETLDAWESDPDLVQSGAFNRTGWAVFGPRDAFAVPSAHQQQQREGTKVVKKETSRLSRDATQQIRDNFRNSSRPDPTIDLTVDDLRQKWGGVLGASDFETYPPAYFNPVPGWVDVPLAMETMFNKALRSGVVKYEVDKVVEVVLDERKEAVTGVRCESGKLYRAKKVLLATGAWTSRLMAPLEDELELTDKERVESQVSAYAVTVAQVQLSEEEKKMYDQMPIAIYGDDVDMLPPTKDGILKFNTVHFQNAVRTGSGHRITTPLSEDQSIIPVDVRQKAIAQLQRIAPRLFDGGRSVDTWRACWDCGTTDRNMLITRHPNPRLSNLYFAIGGSSHSWKFLPIIGKYVANVVNGVGNGIETDNRWAWKVNGLPYSASPKTA